MLEKASKSEPGQEYIRKRWRFWPFPRNNLGKLQLVLTINLDQKLISDGKAPSQKHPFLAAAGAFRRPWSKVAELWAAVGVGKQLFLTLISN